MFIRLDPDACVGHGRCYVLDPTHFSPDDLGHCEVVEPHPCEDVLHGVRRAVNACPEGALVLDEAMSAAGDHGTVDPPQWHSESEKSQASGGDGGTSSAGLRSKNP
jgi:ferredoxin